MNDNSGDSYKRIKINDIEYQCGCKWVKYNNRTIDEYRINGDVLIECTFHAQATKTSVNKLERELRQRIKKMAKKQQKENETTSIKKRDNEQYAIAKISKEQIQEAIQTNLENESISGFDFERINVPTGGSISWEVINDDDEVSSVQNVDGIILLIKPGRKFWEKGFDESDENSAPDCTSNNLINGIPTNPDSDGAYGGECNQCIMNTWGSGKNGKGKACKEIRIIFFLQKDNILPTVLTVPVTSLKPLKKYLTRLTQKMKPYNSVETRFSLNKIKNDSGISYSEIVFTKIRDVDPETVENIKIYGNDLKNIIDSSSISESILSE